jgi:hypothetical protein
MRGRRAGRDRGAGVLSGQRRHGAGAASRLVTPRLAPDQSSPVVATVLAAPHPVRGSDHRIHLAYELLILNPNPVPVFVRRIETFTPAQPRTVLSSLRGAALASVMGSITGAPGRRIGPGRTGLVIMDLSARHRAHVPQRLAHRVKVSSTTPGFPTGQVVTGRTGVADEHAVRVFAPLPGRRWVDVNGCCAGATGHRVAVLSVNGAVHAAQRFAIDFVRLRPNGRLTKGPLGRLSSYPYYGLPVRSATRGRVVGVRDDLPNQAPFQPPSGITLATAPGNHVVVALGRGRFAMYAHLKPGSVRVKRGDRIRAGDILGRIGNSGNTDFPHLRFQLMDSCA